MIFLINYDIIEIIGGNIMALTKDDDLIYLFTGTSEVFIKNRISRILSGLKQSYTIIRYDMENTSLTTVLNDAITVPFLEELKVIILRNPIFLTKTNDDAIPGIKNFIKYLKDPSESTLLIIEADNIKINPANEIYKILKNVALIINYDDSQEIELKGWVVRSFASNNVEIKEEALNTFMEYLNNNQIRMGQEINKLVNYKGSGGTITTEDVKLLVDKDLSNEVFNLIKAIVDHNHNAIAKIYQHIVEGTKDMQNILGMINNNFIDMVTIAKLLKAGYSQNDIAKFYNVTPGRAYYMVKNAKSFKISDLENYIIKLNNLDYLIKSGQIDKNLGIDLLIMQL